MLNGRYHYTEVDMAYPSPSRLSIVRNYSEDVRTGGAFGAGTGMMFEQSLITTPSGRLRYYDASGKIFELTETAPNEYTISGVIPLKNAWAYQNPAGYAADYSALEYEGGLKFIFNTGGYLSEKTWADGYAITIERNVDGGITKLTDSFNRSYTVTPVVLTNRWPSYRRAGVNLMISTTVSAPYNAISAIEDDEGNRVEYNYASVGSGSKLASVVWKLPDGTVDRTVSYSITTTLGSEGHIIGITDSRGTSKTLNTYDTYGRVTRQTHQDGALYEFTYNNFEEVAIPSRTIPTLLSTGVKTPDPLPDLLYTFDTDNDRVISVKEFDYANETGYTTAKTYTTDGSIETIVNPLNETTTYGYDFNGILNSITDAAGNEVVMLFEDYPDHSKPTKIKDPLLNEMVIGYDAKGQPTSVSAPGYSTPVSMTYDTVAGVDMLKTVTGSDGNTLTYNYNSSGMLTSVSHSVRGTLATYDYDAIGRLASAVNADGDESTYTYDDEIRTVTSQNPRGGQTTVAYDANGNMASVSDARGNQVSYTYNSRDMVDSMTDARGNKETYNYKSEFNTHIDRPYSVTDRNGETTAFTYGQVDRYMRADYLANGTNQEFLLDGAKRLISATSSTEGTINLTYTTPSTDGVVGAIKTVSSNEGTVSYSTDALSRRTGMTAGTLDVDYTYNAKGLTNSIAFSESGTGKSGTFNFSYDTIGRLTGISYPNSVNAAFVYNSVGDLTDMDHGTIESLDYSYEPATGMVNGLTRAGINPLMPSISNAIYDGANRMVELNGNALSYDANGNPLTMDGMSMTWNQKGQLTNVSGASAGSIEYKYDALGRRISKTVNSVTIKFLYDGWNMIAEMDGAGTVTAWYVHAGLDRPLVRIASDGTVHYYHQDILGSVIALTDASGTVTTQYNYSPFGEVSITGTDTGQPYQFTGKRYDPETGLTHFPYREYSPDMRRFISEDPLRFAAGDVNFYAYVGNNPVNFVDPLGLYYGDGFDDAYDEAVSNNEIPSELIRAAGDAVDCKVNGCYSVFASCVTSDLFTPGWADYTAVGTSAAVNAHFTNRALDHAISRGLTYPNRSSVYRGLAANAKSAAAAGALGAVDVSIIKCLYYEIKCMNE